MRKFKESNSEAVLPIATIVFLLSKSSGQIFRYLGGFILFSDGLSPLRWTACTKFLSVLFSAVTASREEKSLPFLSSGLSGTSGRTLLNCWQWHLDIWDCTLGWRTRNSQITPNALHGDHPHVFDKTSSWGIAQKPREEALHTRQSESCAVGDVVLCNHCDTSSREGRNLWDPEPCTPLDKGEQVKVLASVWWDSPKEVKVCLQTPCLQWHRSLVCVFFLSRSPEGTVEQRGELSPGKTGNV